MEDFFKLGLADADSEVYSAVCGDLERQNSGVNLIASESYPSRAVLEAAGSILTNKYAEGYAHRRYYGGCEFVDQIEDLAIERAKKLFGAEHVNVQPHSGSSANMAVYMGFLTPGDSILGMDLSHGGHLTHGHPASFSGKIYNPNYYTVSEESGQLDMSEVAAVAKTVKPKLIVCGYSAYPRIIDFKAFREIADDVGAYLMADIAHIAGLVAAKAHPSPIPYADFVTTTTHKTLRGPRGAMIMCQDEHAKKINSSVFPGIQGGPFMHLIAARAVAFKEAMEKSWQDTQHKIVENAGVFAKALVGEEFNLVSGGTDNHLMLVDLRNKDLNGKVAEKSLGDAEITLNKNTIPYDPEKPFVTSGVRIGTPCVTIRGMGSGQMKQIAGWISQVLSNSEDADLKKQVGVEVKNLCEKHPVYKNPIPK